MAILGNWDLPNLLDRLYSASRTRRRVPIDPGKLHICEIISKQVDEMVTISPSAVEVTSGSAIHASMSDGSRSITVSATS